MRFAERSCDNPRDHSSHCWLVDDRSAANSRCFARADCPLAAAWNPPGKDCRGAELWSPAHPRRFLAVESYGKKRRSSSACTVNGPGLRQRRREVHIIRQPVEAVSLYEVFRSANGEYVLKYRQIINSLWAAPGWTPNGIFPRSLGVYLDDNGNLTNPGIPGIGTSGSGSI